MWISLCSSILAVDSVYIYMLKLQLTSHFVENQRRVPMEDWLRGMGDRP